MPSRFASKSFVSMKDVTPDELKLALSTAASVKREPDKYKSAFAGKTLAMIFQKPSLRTRVSFEAGMTQMGGHAIYLGPTDISIGKRETTEDIALVLSRYVNIIMARVFGHDIVVDLAKSATVPVINGLSDHEHPCQVLADLQTIVERRGKLAGLTFAYVGDGNNMTHSLMLGGALAGMSVVSVNPPGYEPAKEVVADAQRIGQTSGAKISVTNDLAQGIKGVDVIYTDVWASMGMEHDAENRKAKFVPYQVNEKVLAQANRDCVVLHCLPAHRGEEITDSVLDGPSSIVLDQAENRLHAQKAVILQLLGGTLDDA